MGAHSLCWFCHVAAHIVIVAYNDQDMQILLHKLHEWSTRWRVLINTEKSKVTGRRKRSGEHFLELTEKYKYLSVIFTEKIDFTLNAENLARGAGRALQSVLLFPNCKHLRNLV